MQFLEYAHHCQTIQLANKHTYYWHINNYDNPNTFPSTIKYILLIHKIIESYLHWYIYMVIKYVSADRPVWDQLTLELSLLRAC